MMKVFCIMLFFSLSLGGCAKQPSYPEPPRVGNDVAVESGTMRPEEPVFFTHRYQGKKINFFVIKVEGRVLSFLDACARCYPAKRGYYFEAGRLVCRECNVNYSVSEIEKGMGSCFPIQITGHLQDGRYLIPLSTLEQMAEKF